MSDSKVLPWYAGAAARLHIVADGAFPYVVFLAADERDAVPAALARPGGLSALVTHDAGRCWPDRQGEALAWAMLEAAGVAALGFVRLGDALACHARLRAP